jgi:hypothetical protein
MQDQIDNLNVNKKIIVYHGSPNENVTPTYGKGEDKHDYGRGFYLTQNKELAKEWSVCTGNSSGYLHTYELDLSNLAIFNFNNVSPLNWIAELMAHRPADNSIRYKRFAPEFISKFRLDISKYDIIYGWRADSSYFSIAKNFVRDNIDYTLISELFHLGGLENQICLKTEKAFKQIYEIGEPEAVTGDYAIKYNKRDDEAREAMKVLMESDRNTLSKGFSYVIREDFTL